MTRDNKGFHVGEGVFTLVTMATFLTLTSTFLDNLKEWSGPFFDAQQLGVRLNFDVDVKKYRSDR